MNLPKKTQYLFIGTLLFISLLSLIDFGFRVLLRDEDLCVLNPGFAFGFGDFIDPVVIVLKIVLLGAIIVIAVREAKKLNPDVILLGAYITIVIGGFTTLAEKVIFANICDYIGVSILTRLYVNLVDLLIVGAIFVIFIKLTRELLKK